MLVVLTTVDKVVGTVVLAGADAVGEGPDDASSQTGGPGIGYALAPLYRSKRMPGSLAEYVPGIDTPAGSVVVPEEAILI